MSPLPKRADRNKSDSAPVQKKKLDLDALMEEAGLSDDDLPDDLPSGDLPDDRNEPDGSLATEGNDDTYKEGEADYDSILSEYESQILDELESNDPTDPSSYLENDYDHNDAINSLYEDGEEYSPDLEDVDWDEDEEDDWGEDSQEEEDDESNEHSDFIVKDSEYSFEEDGLEWERNENGFDDSDDPFSQDHSDNFVQDNNPWADDDMGGSSEDEEIHSGEINEIDDESFFDELEDEDNNETDEGNQEQSDEKKPNGSKKEREKGKKNLKKIPILGSLYGLFKSAYSKVADLFFALIMFVLGIGSRLPYVGRFFKIAMEATTIVRRIAKAFPVLFLIVVLAIVNRGSVDSSVNSDLPDEASVNITDFSLDGDKASAVVTNNSDISVNAEVDLSIYTWQPGINPKTWILHQKSSTCSPAFIEINSGDSADIEVTCKKEKGLFPRVSGEAR